MTTDSFQYRGNLNLVLNLYKYQQGNNLYKLQFTTCKQDPNLQQYTELYAHMHIGFYKYLVSS